MPLVTIVCEKAAADWQISFGSGRPGLWELIALLLSLAEGDRARWLGVALVLGRGRVACRTRLCLERHSMGLSECCSTEMIRRHPRSTSR
ncbi:hypothetical protein B0I35DRAFT_425719 [Stachybotrys elegans]|uniref:Uncharacterized protein n=1 Tax=Stachybotrys elegans TaxID=80388 RepID=A0A8K0T1Z2_9HYPO|nr:hypothetical protein B0I35DRAFT_425719 [Stachybotrys elegans]